MKMTRRTFIERNLKLNIIKTFKKYIKLKEKCIQNEGMKTNPTDGKKERKITHCKSMG